MSDKLDLIEALFYDADLVRFDGSQVVGTGGEAERYMEEGECRKVCPVGPDGRSAFVFGVQEFDATAESWRDCQRIPTASMILPDGMAIHMWAFDPPPQASQVESLARALGMMDAMEDIPLPGGNEWELVHCNPKVSYTLEELEEVYCELTPAPAADTPPWDDEKYGDAVVVTPYDEADKRLAEPIVVTLGRDSHSKRWKPVEMPLGQLVAVFCEHKQGDKDGPSVVLGDMVEGARSKNALKAMYAVGLDLDDGVLTEEVDARIKKQGWMAIRYSTHSHLKTTTEIVRDALLKWSDRNAEGAEISDDLVQEYLLKERRIDPAIVKTARITGEDHKVTGKVIVVSHAPIHKNRIIIPVAEPFLLDKEARTQQEAQAKWARVIEGVGQLLGLPIDKACLDVSRLFYLPRHPKGGKFSASLFGGKLLDWRDLNIEEDIFEAEAKRLNKGGGRSNTDAGKKLGRWSKKAAHGFQIVQVIEDNCPEKLRHQVSTGWEIECPFDDHHSNPGDPEDRACLAVNAGDGPSEIFTLSCRHASCRDRTNLDMLGKMMEDRWFAEEVLEDDTYNIAEVEDASDPVAAVKIDKQDKAKAKWEEAFEKLNPDSGDDQILAAVRLAYLADLGDVTRVKLPELLKERIKQTTSVCGKICKTVAKEVLKEEGEQIDIEDPMGRKVFTYQGEFNFDEAFETAFKTLRRANRDAEKPLYCCIEDQAVRLVEDKRTERIRFGEINARALWSELNEMMTFVRLNENGTGGARAQVPTDVGNQVFEQAYKKLPQAPEVLYTPVFVKSEKNGIELISEPGWYKDLDLLVAESALQVREIPVEPTGEEVDWAVNLLTEDLLGDFPFLDMNSKGEKRREPSLANALAMILTPFMRRLLTSCTPVFFISKPVPGTGGTLLGTIPIYLFDGKLPTPIRYTQSEEEMQKALLAEVMKAESHLFFDDVREFNNRTLLQSITSHYIGGRILGQSKTAERPNTFNWISTGNNPVIYDEMARRIVDVRMNAEMPNIQDRKFRHKNYTEWLEEHRSEIVYAILLLIQNWISYGCKPFTTRTRASFEDWARKVGGVLQAAGIEGFLDNAKRVGADMDEVALRTFVKEWFKKWGPNVHIMPAEMFTYALDMDMAICEGNNDDQKKSRFMRRLPTLDGRTFTLMDDDYMVVIGKNEDEEATYCLQQNVGAELVDA